MSPENVNELLSGLGVTAPVLEVPVVVTTILLLVNPVGGESMVTSVASVDTSIFDKWVDCTAGGHSESVLVGTVVQSVVSCLTLFRTRSLRSWVGSPSTVTVWSDELSDDRPDEFPDDRSDEFPDDRLDELSDDSTRSDVLSGLRYFDRDEPAAMS